MAQTQAALFGVRLGAGEIEAYTVDKSDGSATYLDKFSIAGGWNNSMFDVDTGNNAYYVGTTTSTLYTGDLATGALSGSQTITGVTGNGLDAIATQATGSLFAIDLGVGTFDTYSLNAGTGVATALSSFAATGGWGSGNFAVDTVSDSFYLTTSSGELYKGSLSTGALSATITITGVTGNGIDALHVRSDGSLLAVDLGVGMLTTYGLNSTTAVATTLDTFAIAGGWAPTTLTIDADGEYHSATSTPTLYSGNAATGVASGSNDITGATRLDSLAAIPEPGVILLGVIGGMGFVLRRARRR